MGFNFGVVGVASEPVRRRWTVDDAIIYNLGVGAGRDGVADELALVTENSAGVDPQVIPSFATIAAHPGSRPDIGTIDETRLVHAEQSFELLAPLLPAGELDVRQVVEGIYDKGSGALVVTRSEGRDPESQELVVTHRSGVFVRGAGGFGGERAPASEWKAPLREPDLLLTTSTRREQALWYRVSGDRNPLHSDPDFARRAGFARPILHGMCTYGETCRLLMHALASGEPARFRSMNGRFTYPVEPGDDLVVHVWRDGPDRYQFRTLLADGVVVIDRGTAVIAEPVEIQ